MNSILPTIIISFIAGFIFTISVVTMIELKSKYSRSCKNCKHSIPSTGKDDFLHFYCDLGSYSEISNFPVKEHNCCGHFDYTDELKTEQVKDKAEKLVKR